MFLPVDPHLYFTYIGVMSVLAITPGPSNLFAIATGAQYGRTAAIRGVLGMNSATLVWFAFAALGLSTLVMAFPSVFGLIAIVGGLYVAWLGLRAILGSFRTMAEPDAPPKPSRRGPMFDGFIVQISNPKAVLFFTAVLPPFIDTNRDLAPQLLLFAATTLGLDTLAMTSYGLGGAALTRRMHEPVFARLFSLATGSLLLIASALILFH